MVSVNRETQKQLTARIAEIIETETKLQRGGITAEESAVLQQRLNDLKKPPTIQWKIK
jgi:hypothetical protein